MCLNKFYMLCDKLVQMSTQRMPASPDRLDAEMRSLRFSYDNHHKTVNDELRAVRKIVEEVQIAMKQLSVCIALC